MSEILQVKKQKSEKETVIVDTNKFNDHIAHCLICNADGANVSFQGAVEITKSRFYDTLVANGVIYKDIDEYNEEN